MVGQAPLTLDRGKHKSLSHQQTQAVRIKGWIPTAFRKLTVIQRRKRLAETYSAVYLHLCSQGLPDKDIPTKLGAKRFSSVGKEGDIVDFPYELDIDLLYKKAEEIGVATAAMAALIVTIYIINQLAPGEPQRCMQGSTAAADAQKPLSRSWHISLIVPPGMRMLCAAVASLTSSSS